MKLDRRGFLAFGIGGAVGTGLSPLPWKLTDDLSIWSQNWPWVPDPQDGEYTYADSVCTLCSGGCGISVRMVDDRAVKIEGRDDFPVNRGGICILGLSGLQLLYGPSRIKSPMKRVGNRGGGRFEKISWEDALAETANHLSKLKDAGDAHKLGCITARGEGVVPALFKRFLSAFGSPNSFTMPSMADTQGAMLMDTDGGTQKAMGFDLENADYILSFGAGILDGWGSPVRMFQAHGSWRDNQARLVQVEPRLSNTAAKADQWVPVNPGAYTHLALSIAHELIRSDLFDKVFAGRHIDDFNFFRKQVLNRFSPEETLASTGVPVEIVRNLAAAFGQADNPVALSGQGAGAVPGNYVEAAAVHALNALAGNPNRAGGIRIFSAADYISWADESIDIPRLDRAGTDDYPFVKSLINRLPGLMKNTDDPALKALFVHGANPVYTMPDTASVKKAFDHIPFIVSFSSYMDETAAMSDLILPDHHFLESYRDVPTPPGYPRPFIGLATPIMQPLYNTRATGDVLIQLADTIGDEAAEAFAWEDFTTCLAETLGDKWEDLRENGYWEDASYQPPPWRRFLPGGAGGLKFEEAITAAGKPEGDETEYPLILMATDAMRLSAGYIANPPFMTKTLADTVIKGKDGYVEINPETAKKYGFDECDKVVIATPRGKAAVRVHLAQGLHPEVIALPRGLGHTAYDKFLANKGVNVNDLMGSAEDPVTGLDAAWGIRAKLTRA